MPKNVLIYGRPSCAPCNMLKQYLNKKGVQFNYKNIDESQDAQAEAFAYAGMSIVPVTVITNEDDTKSVFTGFNLQSLAPALS